jgi:hypothetical protein
VVERMAHMAADCSCLCRLAVRRAVVEHAGSAGRGAAGDRRVLVHEPAARTPAWSPDPQPCAQPVAGSGAAGGLVSLRPLPRSPPGTPSRRSAHAARARPGEQLHCRFRLRTAVALAASPLERAAHRDRSHAAGSGHGHRADLG